MNIRYFPPLGVRGGAPGPVGDVPAYYSTPGTVAPVSITATAGQYADVPDFAAASMGAQGWLPAGIGSGPTTARPLPYVARGQFFVDTTLAYAVFSDGITWRNPATGAGV